MPEALKAVAEVNSVPRWAKSGNVKIIGNNWNFKFVFLTTKHGLVKKFIVTS